MSYKKIRVKNFYHSFFILPLTFKSMIDPVLAWFIIILFVIAALVMIVPIIGYVASIPCLIGVWFAEESFSVGGAEALGLYFMIVFGIALVVNLIGSIFTLGFNLLHTLFMVVVMMVILNYLGIGLLSATLIGIISSMFGLGIAKFKKEPIKQKIPKICLSINDKKICNRD